MALWWLALLGLPPVVLVLLFPVSFLELFKLKDTLATLLGCWSVYRGSPSPLLCPDSFVSAVTLDLAYINALVLFTRTWFGQAWSWCSDVALASGQRLLDFIPHRWHPAAIVWFDSLRVYWESRATAIIQEQLPPLLASYAETSNRLARLVLDARIASLHTFALAHNRTQEFIDLVEHSSPPDFHLPNVTLANPFATLPPHLQPSPVPYYEVGFWGAFIVLVCVLAFGVYIKVRSVPSLIGGDLELLSGMALGPAALAPLAQNVNKELKAQAKRPYRAPDHILPLLHANGLDHNPHGQYYTHPFHYYANEKLRSHASNYHKGNSVTVMFMKDGLFPDFTDSPLSVLSNMYITPADIVRYSTGAAQFPQLDTDGLHIDFALHHLSREFFLQVFRSNPRITVTATGAFPIEARFREASVHPEYTLLYSAEHFSYLPENHPGDAYHHLYTSLEWMDCNSLVFDELHVGVSRVASVSACELYVMSACTMGDPSRSYDLAGCVNLPSYYLPLTARATRFVPLNLLASIDSFADRWGDGVYTDYATKAGQSTVLDSTKYTRAQMKVASNLGWLYGNRFHYASSPSYLLVVLSGLYMLLDLVTFGSFHVRLLNKQNTYVNIPCRSYHGVPSLGRLMRDRALFHAPAYSLSGGAAGNIQMILAWCIASVLRFFASKHVALVVLYRSPSLALFLYRLVRGFLSLFGIPMRDLLAVLLLVALHFLPIGLTPLHSVRVTLWNVLGIPEGFSFDHLLALLAQHPAYTSTAIPTTYYQVTLLSVLLLSTMSGVLHPFVLGVLLAVLVLFLAVASAAFLGALARFSPVNRRRVHWEWVEEAVFPDFSVELVPASLLCELQNGQKHGLHPRPPPAVAADPAPINANAPNVAALPRLMIPAVPNYDAGANVNPWDLAFNAAAVAAGAPNHPFLGWFMRPNYVDLPGFVNQARALPAPVVRWQGHVSCFWAAMGQALGIQPNELRHAYLATLPTQAIRNYHLYGFVLDQDIRNFCAYFAVGLRVVDAVNVQQYELQARDNLPVVDAMLAPTANGNLRHFTLPGGRANAGRARVQNIALGRGQPSLIGTVDDVLRTDVPPPVNVVNAVAPLPMPGASAIEYVHGLASVNSAFGAQLGQLQGAPSISAQAAAFQTDFNAPATTIPTPPISWIGPMPLQLSDLGQHTLDLVRASALASAMRDSPSTWQSHALSPDWHKAQKQFIRMPVSTSVRICGLFGVSGCGKSYYVSSHPDLYKDALVYAWFPTAELMQDAIRDRFLGSLPESHYISDFEIYRKTDGEVLIMDDFTAALPGTIDWLISVSPNLHTLILTGDPSQGRSAWPVEGTRVSGLSFEAEYIMSLHGSHINYCNISRRMSKPICSMYGIYSHDSCADDGALVITNHFPDIPVLVASPRFRTTVTAGGVKAYTMCLTQGMTFPADFCVDSGGMTQMMTDNLISMALCRGKRNVIIRYDHQGAPPPGYRFAASEILSSIIGVAAVTGRSVLHPAMPETRAIRHSFMRHFAKSLPPHLFMQDVTQQPALIGAAEMPTSADVLRSVQLHYPQLAFTHESQARSVKPELAADRHVADPALMPVEPLDREAADVERRVGDSATHQLKVDAPVTLHHRRGDVATEEISYQKRIKVSTVEENKADVKVTPESNALKDTFVRLFGPSHTFSEVAYQLCVERVLDSWLSKRTNVAAKAYIDQLDVDVPVTHIKTFLKGQILTKLEKANKEASAGQIVSAPPFIRNMIDAAFALYIEDFLLLAAPPRVYLHLRRTPAQLRSWRQGVGKVPAKFTEIDYTAWDSGVDGKFLTFDLWMFRWFGFPPGYIAFYVYCRVHSFYFAGIIGLMQLSGDRYTFLLNTLHNLLLTFTVYLIALTVWIMFAGDDVLIFGWFFALVRNLYFAMTPKTKHSTQGHFCGYLIDEVGMSAHPQVLYLRFMIAMQCRPTDVDYFRSLVDLITDMPFPHDSPFASTLLPHLELHLVHLGLHREAAMLAGYGRFRSHGFWSPLRIAYSKLSTGVKRIYLTAPGKKNSLAGLFHSSFLLAVFALILLIVTLSGFKFHSTPSLIIDMSTNVAQSSVAAAAPVQLAVGPAAPSRMQIAAGSFDPQLEFTGTVKLTEEHKVARFDFRTMESFQSRVAVFESVLLDSVFFKAGISPGTTGLVQYGVDGNHANPAAITECAIYDFFGGGQMGMASQLFELGASSRFGRELKAVVLGNPTPVFHIGVDGLATNQYVILHFRVKVTVSGNAPPVAIVYQPIKAASAAHTDIEEADTE